MTLKTFLMTFQTRFKFPASIYHTKRSQYLCQFLEAGGVVEIGMTVVDERKIDGTYPWRLGNLLKLLYVLFA